MVKNSFVNDFRNISINIGFSSRRFPRSKISIRLFDLDSSFLWIRIRPPRFIRDSLKCWAFACNKNQYWYAEIPKTDFTATVEQKVETRGRVGAACGRGSEWNKCENWFKIDKLVLSPSNMACVNSHTLRTSGTAERRARNENKNGRFVEIQSRKRNCYK